MKKFNWFEFIITMIVIAGMSYVLYLGFRLLYHAWTA